ncbi:MAG: EAL domain-containing protein [Lachnospiraceae bacterium]|nr:EAL domain-containing protein [Lachnospiraceae bacterium]
MLPVAITYFEDYTPVGDVTSLAVCLIFLILIHSAFINRSMNFFFLQHIIYILVVAALSDMLFHITINYRDTLPLILIYFLRLLFHMSLFTALCLYILYAKEALQLENKIKKPFFIAMTVIFVVAFVVEILGSIYGFGFKIYPDRIVDDDIFIFFGIYVLFMICLGTMIIKYKHRVFKQIFIAVAASAGISFLLMVLQQLHGQSSYTVAAFLLPVYTLLYMIHANPYDINIGSVGEKAFEDLIKVSLAGSSKSGKKSLYLMSLYMHELEEMSGKYPQELQEAVREFIGRFFKSPTLFQITSAHMIMVVDKRKDTDYLKNSQEMLETFKKLYSKMQYDYKIVYTDSDERLDQDNGYIGFLDYLHGKMPENTALIANTEQVDDYMKYKYIVSQLADIQEKNDLNDPRVLVYCQPVYSIRRDAYDTAEALMRLRLPDVGMVFPDIFIPIAEEYKYIRSLTRIILAKTCAAIRRLNVDGYYVKRVSVNFSIYDVREDNFYDTVTGIINDSGINPDQIAFEITESQNEQEFELIKERMNELKGSGIKFYLDDFGTGYSNFERIMELPFDIVKFDRSLVIASGNDEKFKGMVSHLAKMFDDVDYAVLYEGVEDENDEKRCIGMSAKYLQGYKYSKPIPIEQLTKYFKKKDVMENDSSKRSMNGHRCPVCGRTLFEQTGKYEICEVCGWEDDPVQLKDPDLAGGANKMSLNESIKAWNEKTMG